MKKEFNEQAIQMSALFAVVIVLYFLSNPNTMFGIVFTGLFFGVSFYLSINILYYILSMSLIVPPMLMVAYALINDSDFGNAIVDILNKRYGYKSNVELLVEDDTFDIEGVDDDFRQVVEVNGDTYFLYNKDRTGSISIPDRFLSISEALRSLISETKNNHFSKNQISSANLGFDRRKEEDSKLMDDFIDWMVKQDLAVSGGINRPYQLTELGQDFY